ncbi:restriction endonuclease subunit S [Chitinophaga sp. S165]|uniref:restriction endonuclease subunit S n=1 Tax=Chitinophaga sp. S165 TaxID=2135462 RepID=UPI000D7108C7|nr:restriction endonuclease subunit S [Chitinophaga sp. S165]PWV49573.1 type I restriction enzyme S subunit [Chitinophaga sp. S165]
MNKTALNTYDAYKNSGVEWLGEIPEHWEVSRLGNLLFPVAVRNRIDLPLLSITREKAIILRDLDNDEENHNFIPDDLSNYKVLRKGQFGMNKMKAWQGAYGISNFDGIVSPAYFIFELSKKVEPDFFHWAIRSSKYVDLFGAASDGVRIGQWDLSKDRMKGIIFLLPQKAEQTIIARFLDNKAVSIDKAITLKEKQIALLKERRQVIIHQAVTKGLNPDEPMKDSGIDWIGAIPKKWQIKRLKYFISKLESGVSVNASESERASEGEIGVLKTSAVYNDYFDPAENKKVDLSDIRRVSCQVKKGSIIISRMNAPDLVGASGYVDQSYPNLFLPDRLWQTEFTSVKFEAKWLSQVLISSSFRGLISSLSNGSSPSMKNISKGDFLNLAIPCPPFKEQLQIISYIESNSQRISQALTIKNIEIEKLKEYKASLINSAVTGKIKVT